MWVLKVSEVDTDPERRLQNYMENKNEGNETKIMHGDFNCTMDKIDRDGENKTQ